MAFCLPAAEAKRFLDALRDGRLDMNKLATMPSSAARRAAFEPIVGKAMAPEMNALFESKLLLKDQKAGMVRWAKQMSGIKPQLRKDIISRIENLDRVLNPADERDFLADLARRKLGADVTLDETRQIYTLAKAAGDARRQGDATGWDMEAIKRSGHAQMDLADYVESLKPDGRTLFDKFADAANIPRTILTLGHTSAPLVQGWGMISTKPGAEAILKQFSWLKSEKNYRDMMASIIGDPRYQDALKKNGLSITNLGQRLSLREEAIQSTLVEAANEYVKNQAAKVGIPLPNVARAGSRAFTGYLNYVRWNRYSDLLKAAEMRGEDVSPGSKAAKDIAASVNNFTGRGSLGSKLEQAAPVLNALFFAPRKLMGTIQMFNPAKFLDPRISKTARIAAVRQLSGSLLATGAVLALASAVGLNVDFNPKHQNFGKIQLGPDTHLDITGGNAIFLRLAARMFPAGFLGHATTGEGKEYDLGEKGFPTRLEEVSRFLRGKLNPIAATIVDVLAQKTAAGQPISVKDELTQRFVPIFLQSFIRFAQSEPQNAAAFLTAPLVLIGGAVEKGRTLEERYGPFAPAVKELEDSPDWKTMDQKVRFKILDGFKRKVSALKKAQDAAAAAEEDQ